MFRGLVRPVGPKGADTKAMRFLKKVSPGDQGGLSPLAGLLSADGVTAPEVVLDPETPTPGSTLAVLLAEEQAPSRLDSALAQAREEMAAITRATQRALGDPLTDPCEGWRKEPALVGDLIAAAMGIDWRTGEPLGVPGRPLPQGKPAEAWVPDAPPVLYCQQIRPAA